MAIARPREAAANVTGAGADAAQMPSLRAAFVVAWGIGLGAIVALFHFADPWNVLANTRALSLLIGGGIIPLTDADEGFGRGVPDLLFYVSSQDPIAWSLVGVAAALLVLMTLVKAFQFHRFTRLLGGEPSLTQSVFTYVYSHGLSRILPFSAGWTAQATTLESYGVERQDAARIVFLGRGFQVFEVMLFAAVGLFLFGPTQGALLLAWPLVILAVAIFVTGRRRGGGPWIRGTLGSGRDLGRALVRVPGVFVELALYSAAAFLLVDLAAYLISQAFTSETVILNAEASLILMGVVGGYVARLVPIAPGGLGQFEWGFAMVLYTGGLGFPEAVTIPLLVTAVRYVAGAVLVGVVALTMRPAKRSGLDAVVTRYASSPAENGGSVAQPGRSAVARLDVPYEEVPAAISPSSFLARVSIVGFVLLGIYLLDLLAELLMGYWLLESVGLESVFWTNFRVGVVLFLAGFVAFACAFVAPALTTDVSRRVRRWAIASGVFVGILGASWLAGQYLTYLAALKGEPFGKDDPIFGHDIGFYVFALPAIELTVYVALAAALVALCVSVACAFVARSAMARESFVEKIATPATLVSIGLVGVLGAAALFLRRYDLLLADNYESAIPTGAEALDVTGFLSTKNAIGVDALAVLAGAAALVWVLWSSRRRAHRRTRSLALAVCVPVAVALGFHGVVEVRNQVRITPNEPVAQLPYIQHHIDATVDAYGLGDIEVSEFRPKGVADPLPDAEELLRSPTLRNAPLWPGYISKFERMIDPEYVERVKLAGGDPTIYAPSLHMFRAQEKLRPYYDFMDVDTTRYSVDGEPRLFATSVRELPLEEPKPWLTYWGQRFLLFTHGFGLVGAPLSELTRAGEPEYAVRGIPPRGDARLSAGNQRIYYGEGSGTLAFSNVDGVKEHDFPTDQGRAELTFPDDVDAGVRLDSVVKRLVVGWKSRTLLDVLFSGIVGSNTRVHYQRTPLERIGGVAPFLHLDSDPYAVTGNGRVSWLVNGMTTTDRYPYSAFGDLGDKSDRRSPTPANVRRVNYVADSVKATVDAYTGRVRLYQARDEPIVSTWAKIYPELIEPISAMPRELREHVQYPVQLMHIQFDDLYIYYHQRDALTFFSLEDLFDDSDEVLGPILSDGRAISFSIEPYYWIAPAGDELPAAARKDQFALSMVFTPEGARNLRAIATAYMDGDDYGRLSVLQVPKGEFHLGPEQADAAIDQDASIAQQIGLWNRRGLDVIRGHTTPLIVEGEVIYVEPIFLSSRQSPVPQLRRVVVVIRGVPAMGRTLEEALRKAVRLAASARPATR